MTERRKHWLRFVCLSALFLFFAQSALCLAEHAGLVGCTEAAELADCPPADHSHDSSNAHCCHLETNAAPHLASTYAFQGVFVSERLSLSDDVAPDGPVQEIDYPPQLS